MDGGRPSTVEQFGGTRDKTLEQLRVVGFSLLATVSFPQIIWAYSYKAFYLTTNSIPKLH